MHCECLRLADRPPPPPPHSLGRTGGEMGLMDGWTVRGWYQCCCGLNGFLRGDIPLVFPRWQREDGAGWRFLPVLSGTQTVWGGGSLELFQALGLTREKVDLSPFWSVTQRPQAPSPPWSLYDRSFFLVFFGAATKCAMCYVAWFLFFSFFFTSYEAHL